MTTRDRLASARQSSNLADKPDRLTDVSVLAAAGMVATGQAVGMALLRLRDSLDARSWPFCLAAVATRTRTLCSSLDPKISEREQHDLASTSWQMGGSDVPACRPPVRDDHRHAAHVRQAVPEMQGAGVSIEAGFRLSRARMSGVDG